MAKPAEPLSHGTFFAVVGPSGVGKDTLIDFAHAALGDDNRFAFPRRVITRPVSAGGEDHIAVTREQFERMRRQGGFMIDWDAHGLSYGIPANVAALADAGVNAVVNLSRAAIEPLCATVQHVEIVHVTAPLDIIAERLSQRGRETPQAIRERLGRAAYALLDTAPVSTVVNAGTVESGGAALVEILKSRCGSDGAAPDE